MTEDSTPNKPAKTSARADSSAPRAVLQVERRDFTDLVPAQRERAQSMHGFDPCYTDIVDYIIRCTHRIWDERDVGLIYTHYTHNCVAYSSLGTVYNREDIVRETIQRIVELPDRRGMATQVIWRGDDVNGFYTSHLVTGSGRHTEYGMFGKPTGRTFVARTIADCMIHENKIYREWLVRDNMALIVQLGLDPHAVATDMARKQFEKGNTVVEIGENRRMIGQYPPADKADTSIAHNDTEVQMLEWLHHIYNKRMFGKIESIYAPNVQWHGPLMRELFGVAAVLQQTMRLVAMIPDGYLVPQHICSNRCEEGGEKIAVRWVMDGHHLGYGSLGAPTGHRLFVMGMSHFHVIDGKIVDEWVVYDDLSMLVQLKLAEMAGAV
jgi:predicted ester cyclase